MLLREMAHARTGDKGDIVNISLIAWRPEDFPILERQVTAERVHAYFAAIVDRTVLRYTLPHLSALNFVLHRPEGQAVTRSLALDAHGKCLGSALLAMKLESEAGTGT
ncbi:MAG TPA: hypothetical protein VHX13_13810 [Acidobacteriaceae bacterium]|jgi:hypothetical protein|nr:hypothetical protein [Acidobacteriaceae bacterium]